MQKQKIGLQYYQSIPRRVTSIYDNLIDFNENKYLFKDLDQVSPSDDWLPHGYIDAEVNNKLGKTKGWLAGYEMGKKTKHYVEYLDHDTNRLKIITI